MEPDRTLGSAGAFWLYAGICVAGFVFVRLRLPETKGKSLEQDREGTDGLTSGKSRWLGSQFKHQISATKSRRRTPKAEAILTNASTEIFSSPRSTSLT